MTTTSISVNFEYLVQSIKETIEKDLILKELHSLMNEYCINVTGENKDHVTLEELERIFFNKEVVNLTINYGLQCLNEIDELEKPCILKIIKCLEKLRSYYENCLPF